MPAYNNGLRISQSRNLSSKTAKYFCDWFFAGEICFMNLINNLTVSIGHFPKNQLTIPYGIEPKVVRHVSDRWKMVMVRWAPTKKRKRHHQKKNLYTQFLCGHDWIFDFLENRPFFNYFFLSNRFIDWAENFTCNREWMGLQICIVRISVWAPYRWEKLSWKLKIEKTQHTYPENFHFYSPN